jgi:general secretion pathway protein G
MKRAFTMIELIFVIVILGILSSVAISKMAVTRDDAQIAKGRSQVAAIRNAITLFRNTQMLQGNGATWINKLDGLTGATSSDGDALFDNNGTATVSLLDYPIYAKNANGHWRKTADNVYAFRVMNTDIPFVYGGKSGVTVGGKTYRAGQFDCKHGTANNAEKYCKALTE